MYARSFVVLTLGAFCIATAAAQSLDDFERSRFGSASYYNYSEAADVTVLVNVWGTVRNPGLYEIPQGTSLSHLLSLSGGPIVSPRNGRQDRTIQVRLFRDMEGGRTVIYATEMENEILATGEDPVIQEGDVVTIETVLRQRISWRDIFPVIAAVGTVAIAIERIAR